MGLEAVNEANPGSNHCLNKTTSAFFTLKVLLCEFDLTAKAEFTGSCLAATCPLSNFIRRIASFLPAPLTCNMSLGSFQHILGSNSPLGFMIFLLVP